MNIFQQITEYVKRDYSTFDMKNNWVGSVNDFGSLNCIYHSIVLPSDTWKMGHNLLVKLPPLVAPAFTRIKGVVNSFYCSFASVWNYWNSFISDKPEDVFLSRSLTGSYKGKFVEPCVRTTLIALICKIAKGYFDFVSSDAFSYSWSSGTLSVTFRTVCRHSTSTYATPTSLVWGIGYDGRRKCTGTSNVSTFDGSGDAFWHDMPSALTFTFKDFGSNGVETPESLGFFSFGDYFIYQCQQVERNLSNHGVPTDLMASTDISFYSSEYFNLLTFICESSIWHNMYRDEQNQSPELDFREVNGALCNPASVLGNPDSSMPYGWKLRTLGIPPNVSTGSDYWFPVSTVERAFSVLTGFMLEETFRSYFTGLSPATNIDILPKFYNGLLVLKFRNFEKDYFTSACVDPNAGGVSVQVPNTIDALRTASKLEEFLEVSASARDFYNFMKHIFGTNPESTRYQKPLLLGTEVVPVQIGEQLQTSQTTTGINGSPLGERGGIADGYGNGGSVNHYFNEHGLLVSFLSFVLDSQYMQGLPHEFNHHLQLDYPFPQFANLSAESIPVKEIFYSNQNLNQGVDYETGDNNAVRNNSSFSVNSVDDMSVGALPPGVHVSDDVVYNLAGSVTYGVVGDVDVYSHTPQQSVFGYTPRYSRWKFKPDIVAGQMRSSLEYWHTFRHFFSRPYISNNFVSYMNAGFLSDLNRIFAVVNDNADKFYVDVFNNASVRRCLPLVPQTTID